MERDFELGVPARRRGVYRTRAKPRRSLDRAAACVLVSVIAAGALVLLARLPPRQDRPPSETHRPAAPRPVPLVAPSTVLLEEPYAGVACAGANSVACDRVGLSIKLRVPALSATATIDGRALDLDDRTWSDNPVRGRHMILAGFLKPAGLLSGPLRVDLRGSDSSWAGRPPVLAKVDLMIDEGHGRRLRTATLVALHAGWG